MSAKRRNESFFGIHMDFHANPAKGLKIGETLKEDDIREILRLLKPDFLQVDCKGHPGWVSYPTEIGNAMPEFCGDPLALWRKVTKEERVALYVHYSGIYDIKYASEHPSESIVTKDGKRSTDVVKPNGRYIDDVLIPQFRELAEKYGIDGVWIDGDCWGTACDYSEEAIKGFEAETGINLKGKAPKEETDPYYAEFRDYFREVYRRYVRKYTDALHSEYPEFQIASNWAFTDHMPEPVSANVDYLSGDLNPSDSFRSARYAGRVIASQNMPWDLMSWNFRFIFEGIPFTTPKHPVQIMQEAASVISLGGGFQNYVPQFHDGSPIMAEIRDLKPLAEFMRARQPFCFKGKIVPQVQILLSTYDRHHEVKNLYSRDGFERFMGLTSLLCDAAQSTEIVMEHSVDFSSPVIVLPELYYDLEDETKARLVKYVENGGNLVLTGKNSCRKFSEVFGYKTEEAPILWSTANSNLDNGHGTEKTANNDGSYFSEDGAHFGNVISADKLVSEKGETVAELYSHFRIKTGDFVKVIPCGKGNVVPIPADIGLQYCKNMQYTVRNLVKSVMERLYSPIAKIESAVGKAEIVCLNKSGRLMLQIVNANGNHFSPNSATEDTIPPVVDLKISLKDKPVSLVLQPEGKRMEYKAENGRYAFMLPRVDLHSVVEITY